MHIKGTPFKSPFNKSPTSWNEFIIYGRQIYEIPAIYSSYLSHLPAVMSIK
jgi:hypothetical protein